MLKQILNVALAYVGVIVGAGLSSGQDLMQYFVSFGKWGILGAVILGILNAVFGKIIITFGSYFRSNDHFEVLSQIAGSITNKILDISLIICCFVVGFVMIAGAGSNLNQQFGMPFWSGALLCAVLIILVSFLDFEKITNVIGIFTPIIFIMIMIMAVYTFASQRFDFKELETIGVAEKGGTLGGFIIGIIITVTTCILYANVKLATTVDIPMLAIAKQIHPAFAFVYALVIFGLIFNTAFSLFYALAKRFSSNQSKRFYPIMIGTVVVGYILSFMGFKKLVSIMYPILGYIGFIMLMVLLIGWIKERSNIRDEKFLRRKMIRLITKKYDDEQEYTKADKEKFQKLGEDSIVDTKSIKSDIKDLVKEQFADDNK